MAGKLAASVFLEFVSQPNWIGYSAITRLELFGYPGLGDEEEQKITELLKQFSEISVHSRIIDKAIIIRKATRIKVSDAIIAATAIEDDCFLLTRNIEDFKGISGLMVIDPFGIQP